MMVFTPEQAARMKAVATQMMERIAELFPEKQRDERAPGLMWWSPPGTEAAARKLMEPIIQAEIAREE